MLHDNPVILPETDTFQPEEAAFHLPASLESSRVAIQPQGAVTGDNEGKRIVCKRIPDRPSSRRHPDIPCDPAVGTYISPRDPGFCEEHAPLEGGTLVEIENPRIETYVRSPEKILYPGHQGMDG
jgi:hypothetical protein